MNDDPVIQHLIAWANADPQIRAVIWTSTRTNPAAKTDALSDYDIILVVEDIAPFHADEGWLGDFGRVLVVYTDPIYHEYDQPTFANIIQYEDGLKIDFTLMPVGLWQQIVDEPKLRDDLDVGYRVLVDKDNLSAGLAPPTYKAYTVTPPDEATYLEAIELFFHEGTYVAKNLWRDELLLAKHCFETEMRLQHLRTMLEWRAGVAHNWQIKTGVYGKGLKKQLPPEVWDSLAPTYAGADIEDNWAAFFAMIAVFRDLAVAVGESLGYAYPAELHRRSMAYFHDVRRLSHDAKLFRRNIEPGDST